MTFRQMELFIAVCEEKSINRASEKYFVSQQGISKMMRDLEIELGCTLLNRTSYGVTPTKNGVFFLNECRSMLERKDNLCANITKIQDIPVETVYLGMAFGTIASIPYRLILDYEHNHDFVKIEYIDHPDLRLEELLKKGNYDFGISTGVFDTDEFVCDKVYSEDVYVCIPKTHELFTKNVLSLSDLDGQNFAMFNTEYNIRTNFMRVCKNLGVNHNIEISSGDFNSLKEIAKYNNLLFVVPEHTVSDDDSSLKYLKFPDDSFKWDIYFIQKKGKQLSDTAKDFYIYMKNQCKAMFE